MKAARVFCSVTLAILSVCCGCRKNQPAIIDHPRNFPGVAIQEVTFFSAALNRTMPYRVYLPQTIVEGKRLPVVYQLHGGNGGFRDWSNYSDVGAYANRGLILVMVEGAFSYYMNAVGKPDLRYEDYLFTDLIHDVETRFSAASTQEAPAIVGISMGGFAAIKFALDHPERFAFAAAFSPSIDILHRRFNIRRTGEWMRTRAIFGPLGSESRRARDPLVLVQTAEPGKTPFLYISSGDKEPLLAPIRRFTDLLEKRGYAYEFHTAPGGHDWGEWNAQVPGCFESLLAHIHPAQR